MYSLTERPGFLRLYTRKEKISDKADASYLGIRQKSYQFRLSAGVEFNPSKEGETAGLVLYQNHENHLLMEIAKKGNGRYFIVTTNIHGIKQMIAERELESVGLVEINIRANVQEADIWITEGDIRTQVARNVDLLPYTTERAGGFVGCTMGMYASANGNESANYGDFAWLLYEK
jgi:alpha-N-arabinofuranosidase